MSHLQMNQPLILNRMNFDSRMNQALILNMNRMNRKSLHIYRRHQMLLLSNDRSKKKRPFKKTKKNNQLINLVKTLISNHQFFELTIASKTIYCRFVTICKNTINEKTYIFDFDFDFDFNRLLNQIVIYSITHEMIFLNEKLLNYKQIMNNLFANQ